MKLLVVGALGGYQCKQGRSMTNISSYIDNVYLVTDLFSELSGDISLPTPPRVAAA